MTQKERVFRFIQWRGTVATWDLEEWAAQFTGKAKMLGGSATRHARSLLLAGKVKHPIEHGARNKHKYAIGNPGTML